MHDSEPDTDGRDGPGGPAPRAPRRRPWWPWVLGTLVVVAVTAGVLVWRATRPPEPVSVAAVVSSFRSAQPPPASSGTSAGTAAGDGPARGVYVYATTGWERVSTGNVTHHYPSRTTVTVTDTPCGLRARWDALAGRWAQWDLCRTTTGWQLQHYIDAHKFLYVQDIHDYDCSGYPVVVCRTDSGVLTSTVEPVSPGHLRITQEATGKSVSTGVIEVWVLPSGLPRRVVVDDHGSQTVLGQKVDYTESATFTLTSTTPRR